MKVVLLGPYPPPHGGVQTNLVAIRDLLRASGHECQVVNITRHRRDAADGVHYPRGAGELMRLLPRLEADLLHLHFGGHLSDRLLALALYATAIPRRRTVLTFHSGGYPSSPAGLTARPGTLRGFVLRRFDGLIAVNAEIAAMFRRFGVPARRIRTILPFSVNPPDRSQALPDRLQAFLSAHRPAMLTVCQLEPEYDLPLQIETLGRILDRHPRAGLIIAGSGSLESEIRARVDAQPWRDHILLYGDMPHSVTLRATQECDALLRTTLYDGDSISVREALYIGAPVIASDNGMRPAGVRLIPARNSDALREALLAAFADPAARRPMAGDGQENIRAVLDFYRAILAE